GCRARGGPETSSMVNWTVPARNTLSYRKPAGMSLIRLSFASTSPDCARCTIATTMRRVDDHDTRRIAGANQHRSAGVFWEAVHSRPSHLGVVDPGFPGQRLDAGATPRQLPRIGRS